MLKLNIEGAVEVLAIEVMRSIRRNFEEEGRPIKWVKSKKAKKYKGTKTLTISGNLSNVLSRTEIAGEVGVVTIELNPLARAYGKILNDGGSYVRAGRVMRFRKNSNGKTVIAKKSHKKVWQRVGRTTTVNVPARPFMVVPDGDWSKIRERVLKELTIDSPWRNN